AKDDVEAEKWYKLAISQMGQAVELGDNDALRMLYEYVHFETAGVAGNEVAKRWHDEFVSRYSRAAARGCVPSQAWLAERAESRWKPTKKDTERFEYEALMWWTIVGTGNDPQHRSIIEKARNKLASQALSPAARELVLNKAARC